MIPIKILRTFFRALEKIIQKFKEYDTKVHQKTHETMNIQNYPKE